ncbi:rRNA maturation RNase YbeY [Allorhodopirellula solitaria]|uniref:Endoribonuclease YbeY n=1 Tax=Allorhodopirellula solitaria TaxID=2527987 RepID=A0A5C5YFN4_9BACT|nr:rRNA maturation RNase YbeY [Allorhodopirellula solitaria]TWT74090.1 Endoribonuclease YbeY [Allorhodopirellula solitaria]
MSEIEIRIDASVRQRVQHHSTTEYPLDRQAIEAAVIAAASVGDCNDCHLGVRITTDAVIHQINREFLQHDYPTDVISFPYALSPPKVEGELVVSLDTAVSQATDAGWSVAQELLLYVIHGTLHLVGFDDRGDADRSAMREAETQAMTLLTPRSDSLSA